MSIRAENHRALLEAHDRRVTELLEANTREVERRREAEQEVLKLRERLRRWETMSILGVGDGGGQLFVYGEHTAIKRAQRAILAAGRLAAAERERDEWANAFDIEHDAHIACQNRAERLEAVLEEAHDLIETVGCSPDNGHRYWELRDALDVERNGWQPTHRHRKGGLYRVLMRGTREADLAPVVIYDDAEGRVWVRPAAEFDDGRFTALAAERGETRSAPRGRKPLSRRSREAKDDRSDDARDGRGDRRAQGGGGEGDEGRVGRGS